MLKQYLIVSYGILVKAGSWDLEQTESSSKQIVPEGYRIKVAEYLAAQNVTQ